MSKQRLYAKRGAVGLFLIALVQSLIDSSPLSPLADTSYPLKLFGAAVIAALVASLGAVVGFLVGWLVDHQTTISAPPLQQQQAAPDSRDQVSSSPMGNGPSQLPEEQFWSHALAELDSSSRRSGLWAKCYSEAEGQEATARAAYLRHRVQELRSRPVTSVQSTKVSTPLHSLARQVLSVDSLSHAEELAQMMGYKIEKSGGSFLGSPSFRVVSDNLEQDLRFENWEQFVGWVRRVVCPAALAAEK